MCRSCCQADSGPVDVVAKLEPMHVGMLHFFDKVSPKQIRESPCETVKINDLKHILSSCGEKLSEEELEEMAKEIRTNCTTSDGRVNWKEFVAMIQN